MNEKNKAKVCGSEKSAIWEVHTLCLEKKRKKDYYFFKFFNQQVFIPCWSKFCLTPSLS